MKANWVRRVGWGFVSSLLLAAVAVGVGAVSAQAPAASAPQAKSDATESAEKATEKKASGRLPAYYAEVVSKEQRAKIYEFQAKYGELVTKLRSQIEMLEKQLQSDVESVLTVDQREHIAKRVAEAKAKRSKAGPESATNGAKAE